MGWLDKILGASKPVVSVALWTAPPPTRRGLPVYEDSIQGQKLGRRDIIVTCGDREKRLDISSLRAELHAGTIPGDSPVLVTTLYCQETYYCGEGTVAEAVAAWESAPLESYDVQDCARMIEEFDLPKYDISTKSAYEDLTRLYRRCLSYYNSIAENNTEFKRFPKAATRDLVFRLDAEQPGWDSSNGAERFADEVRRRHPGLLRTAAEKRRKATREKDRDIAREARRPLIDTRNFLTEFPHKDMVIETKDFGPIAIRDVKQKIREGVIGPESPVRYRADAEWMELCDFASDWLQNKATARQLDYLAALQKQHGITAEIPLDLSRREASDRISALAPPRDEQV
jgi:hypothetical protein